MRISTLAAPAVLLAGCGSVVQPDSVSLRQQVENTERAFARAMSERDFTSFTSFLSGEAVFLSGSEAARGSEAVARRWQKYFEGEQAPFSWEPDRVEVLGSGKLALSTGPVRDETGRLIGRFTSIWRLEQPGVWRIIFDMGAAACECPVP